MLKIMHPSRLSWDACMRNKPCNTVGLGDGAILAKTCMDSPENCSLLFDMSYTWGLEWGGPIYLLHTNMHLSQTFLCVNNLFGAYCITNPDMDCIKLGGP